MNKDGIIIAVSEIRQIKKYILSGDDRVERLKSMDHWLNVIERCTDLSKAEERVYYGIQRTSGTVSAVAAFLHMKENLVSAYASRIAKKGYIVIQDKGYKVTRH